MKLLVLLDFDGVLFNSAFEAYKVCESVKNRYPNQYREVSFENFMEFRSFLTDAWQFNRLYSNSLFLSDFSELIGLIPVEGDNVFAERFFYARKEMMHGEDWPKIMSPYSFFFQIKDLLNNNPNLFSIMSTRNIDSIDKTLKFYGVSGIKVYGQEHIRKFGSKISVAKAYNLISAGITTVYVDDMNSHLEPFEDEVDFCIHAGWGYDASNESSFTEGQALKIISTLVALIN